MCANACSGWRAASIAYGLDMIPRVAGGVLAALAAASALVTAAALPEPPFRLAAAATAAAAEIDTQRSCMSRE